jgi:predicted ABC-type ATPase
MEQPELFVFAGPNGAGKSTLSSSMVPPGTPVFDGDKEFMLLKRQFPGLDSGNLYDAVNGACIFGLERNHASQKYNLCFRD